MSAAPRRILIVDDEPGILTCLRRTLKREGYDVMTCASPAEALALLQSQRFDLLLSDHHMPGMSGLELMKRVRETHPDMLRVMLTGEADLTTVLAAVNDGEVYRFVMKPWDTDQLKATLATGLRGLDSEQERRRLGAVVERWHASF